MGRPLSYCILSLLLMAFGFNASAQLNMEYNPNMPIVKSGDTLKNPWGGGFNYPQFSDFDFDYDGDLDLFIFDRSKNVVRIFLQENDGQGPYYKYMPRGGDFFPSDIRYRATLVDYDNDGKKDLFTYTPGGMIVYRNTGDQISGLQWTVAVSLLESEYHNGVSNLNVSSSDIPAIVDVDFDGDIDILTFHIGGLHLEYHQNQSMEIYGIPDSLEFVQKNQCWGKFREDQNDNSILLNDPNAPCVNGDINNPEKFLKHAGSSLLALDIDNSGVMDLILGDVSYPNLTLLINGGTAPNTDSPMISVDPSFPSNTTPTNVQLFPAAFWLDVDFDGVKDLIVCPNAKNISENETSVRFYRNIGSNSLPNFIFSENDFLQNQMIEHGTGSIPVFVDLNEDGLEDLIVGNFFRYKNLLNKESTLAYYINTGSANDPVYTFIDSDFANLSNENYGLRTVPSFGDLDNDGDQDMILGREDGTLVYYENTSTGGAPIFNTGIVNYTDNLGATINVTSYSFPQLFDLDDDGLLDLIVGNKAGTLRYYRNIGTVNAASFEMTNDTLGNVLIPSSLPDAYASPHFFRNNDATFLYCGNFDGELVFYEDIDGNIGNGQSFTLSNADQFDLDCGGYSSFFVRDLNNNGRLEMYVGQDHGGLYRFEHDPNSQSSIEEIELHEVLLHPNPAADHVNLRSSHRMKQVLVIDLQGKELLEKEINATEATLSCQKLSQGVYLVLIKFDDGSYQTERLVKN